MVKGGADKNNCAQHGHQPHSFLLLSFGAGLADHATMRTLLSIIIISTCESCPVSAGLVLHIFMFVAEQPDSEVPYALLCMHHAV